MKSTIYGWVSTAAKYAGKKLDSAIDLINAELSSNKSLLNWIYAGLYMWLVIFCALEDPATRNTAIAYTAGIVSIIFSSWVVSGSYEKVAKMRIEASVKPAKNEDGESA